MQFAQVYLLQVWCVYLHSYIVHACYCGSQVETCMHTFRVPNAIGFMLGISTYSYKFT